MIRQIMMLFILFTGTIFSLYSCAGKSANAGAKPEKPFGQIVHESFHYNIQSAAAKNELKTINLKGLSYGHRLEIEILREIAQVQNKNELQRVFDKFWNKNQTFREILNQPQENKNMAPVQGLTYYLLSVSNSLSWQKQTSERIFKTALSSVRPDVFSGYTHHFFTLALLNNGKYKEALPWLLKLKNKTAPQYYTEDLQKAFVMSEDGKDIETAITLLSLICEMIALNKNIVLNESIIDFSVISMINKGNLDILSSGIYPAVQKYPELKKLTFIKRIIDDNTLPENGMIARSPELWLKIQVIQADNSTAFIDPELADARRELQKHLAYSCFTMVGSNVLRLRKGEAGSVKIMPDSSAGFEVMNLNGETARFRVSITEHEKVQFRSVVESDSGGTILISGPKDRNRQILLRISTHNQYSL